MFSFKSLIMNFRISFTVRFDLEKSKKIKKILVKCQENYEKSQKK